MLLLVYELRDVSIYKEKHAGKEAAKAKGRRGKRERTTQFVPSMPVVIVHGLLTPGPSYFTLYSITSLEIARK